jgi:hypothetical protein
VPRVSYTQQFKNPGEVERFPKLKLDKGEKSRIWLPEEPWMEWYHRIEAPMIEDGEIVMEVKDTKRGPVEAMKMDWIGSAFCLGKTGTPDDPGPLMLEGIDPGNCPVCESAASNTGVGGPQQRFATNVIKYKVRGRGQNPYDLAAPVSAEVRVWAYTGRIHGTLYELGTEFGDLRKHDVKLELEDGPRADDYQKMKLISVILEPAYKDPKVRQYVTDLWKDPDNRATDEQLRDACLGRDYARPVLLDMVRRAERQWRDSERGGSSGSSGGDSGAADAGFNGNLDAGIDSLLGGPAAGADPLADHPGGTEEFMSADQRAAAAAEKDRFVEAEMAAADDPFADETPAVSGATTTSTAAPAAGSRSRTEPKPAGSAPVSSDDPFADAGQEAAPSGTTSPADAETAASTQTAPPSEDAARDKAVEEAADNLFGESSGDSAPPEPARTGNGQRRKAKAEEPAPAAVPAGSGGVIDFDDLFKD